MAMCLVVDDDEIARKAATLMIHELGLETAEMDDGKQAAGFCMGKMPDVILVDIMMPNLNGVDFVKALRALPGGSYPFVIANSAASKDDERITQVVEAGANVFLPKPFGFTDLLVLLEERNLVPKT